MTHVFVSDIKSGQTIDDIFMVKEPILRSTTKGDLYIAMYLLDKTGQLNGRMWQATEQVYTMLPKPGFVHIQGRSELYKDSLQIIVNHISVIDPSQVNLEDFLPQTDKDVEALFKEITDILASIKNEQVKALMREFVTDKELMAKFKKAPAAAKLHHAYLGGLIEHTHNLLKVAQAVLPFYPDVQDDLVYAGLFLHDMGKTDELYYDMAFGYTNTGQLVGHISQIMLMLHKKADALIAKGKKIEQQVLDCLDHIILSHHGQYDFGSPKLPAIPEAFMVNYIDDMDAKIYQVTKAIDDEQSDADWTAFKGPLQTRIYRKRLEDD